MNAFTATFDQFNASMLNKSIDFLEEILRMTTFEQ